MSTPAPQINIASLEQEGLALIAQQAIAHAGGGNQAKELAAAETAKTVGEILQNGSAGNIDTALAELKTLFGNTTDPALKLIIGQFWNMATPVIKTEYLLVENAPGVGDLMKGQMATAAAAALQSANAYISAYQALDKARQTAGK